MIQRISVFVKTYLLFLALFMIQKPLFMLFYWDKYSPFSPLEWLKVIYHGIPLDLSIAGYFTILPGLILLHSIWSSTHQIKNGLKFYFGFAATLISIVFVADLALYGPWGFRLDSTPLFYLSSPKNALASSHWGAIMGAIFAFLFLTTGIYWLFNQWVVKPITWLIDIHKRIRAGALFLALTGSLIIPIRGGLGVSTMNVGQVYFSSHMVLNHAAINPIFSLLDSIFRDEQFGNQHRYFESKEAAALFKSASEQTPTDSIESLFKTEKPNIIFVVLESFMSKVVEPLGGIPNVAINLNRYCEEGVLFTNLYANSFRTDRGLVSIFSGYPGQPTTSIMKYPAKSQTLPSIPKSLKKQGYHLSFDYGGDADFTNMRSYFRAMGIDEMISDRDFPSAQKNMKWGAHDEFLFNCVISGLKTSPPPTPFCKIILTLSSHEPFEVPFHRLKDPYLNSIAYTDSCLGVFISQLQKTPLWDNSVVVLVPDHGFAFQVEGHDPIRFQIPLIFVGGAIKKPIKIDTFGSQIDLAATLLGQLNIDYTPFIFSKNMLNSASPHFGLYSFNNGFGVVDSTSQVIFNCESKQPILTHGSHSDQLMSTGKAILQTLYDDLERR